MCAKLNSKYFTRREMELLKSKGISMSCAIKRHNKGWTIEEITEEVQKVPFKKRDSKYFTKREMEILEEKNIPLSKAIVRITQYGWTKNEAMELKLRKNPVKTTHKPLKKDVFAMYKGDKFIMSGTVDEVLKAAMNYGWCIDEIHVSIMAETK